MGHKKRCILITCCMLAVLCVIVFAVHHVAGKLERKRIHRGFAIAPVPLDLRGKDKALVGLGSYIVNAQAGCNGCHTSPPYAPGGNPFLGQPKKINTAHYLAGGTRFGDVVSDNITPDKAGRPAGRTFKEFLQLMRTGRSRGRLLQVMPWPVFQDMTDHDLRAIYEYLTAIPHAEPPPSKATSPRAETTDGQ